MIFAAGRGNNVRIVADNSAWGGKAFQPSTATFSHRANCSEENLGKGRSEFFKGFLERLLSAGIVEMDTKSALGKCSEKAWQRHRASIREQHLGPVRAMHLV